jgi:hypothetical protein
MPKDQTKASTPDSNAALAYKFWRARCFREDLLRAVCANSKDRHNSNDVCCIDLKNNNHVRTLFAALLLCFAFAIAASASSITFNTRPMFTDGTNYVGYVGATVNGTSSQLISDDFYHITYVPSGPETYDFSSIPSLTNARFNTHGTTYNPFTKQDMSTGVLDYEVAAILLTEANSLPKSQSLMSLFQHALWDDFTTPSAFPNDGSTGLLASTTNIVEATGNAYANIYSKLGIYTPVGASAGNQEFLTLDPPPPPETPEPDTYGVIGVGLLVFGIVQRKQSQQRSRSRQVHFQEIEFEAVATRGLRCPLSL